MKYKLTPIKKIDTVEVTNTIVYDLSVKDNNSYCVANNIIVHNSNCSTRMVTGVGRPQLSSVIECASAAHNLKNGDKRLGLICADGGCKEYGDINKAFCGGADFVMLGGMFAGTDECDGEWKYLLGEKKFLTHYGMSSQYAQDLYYGGRKDYITPEGIVGEVPYKGLASNIAQEILGSIRSACSYIGTLEIKHMSKHARFVKVNRVK